MRNLLFLATALCCLVSCKDDEDFQRLRFWTDQNLEVEPLLFLYANEELLGEFDRSLPTADCSTLGTLAFDLPVRTSVRITVRDAQGQSVNIATIDVQNATSGINVNTDESDDDTVIRF
ncbi:MAG: hypothetical protein AAGA85_19105, partial [Bacteroidota bacterium]